jgi:hypothetical protein
MIPAPSSGGLRLRPLGAASSKPRRAPAVILCQESAAGAPLTAGVVSMQGDAMGHVRRPPSNRGDEYSGAGSAAYTACAARVARTWASRTAGSSSVCRHARDVHRSARAISPGLTPGAAASGRSPRWHVFGAGTPPLAVVGPMPAPHPRRQSSRRQSRRRSWQNRPDSRTSTLRSQHYCRGRG